MKHNVILVPEYYTAYKWIGNNRVPYSKQETKCSNCGYYFHGALTEEVEQLVKINYHPSCKETQGNSVITKLARILGFGDNWAKHCGKCNRGVIECECTIGGKDIDK